MKKILLTILIVTATFLGTARAGELSLEGFGTRWFSGGEVQKTLLAGKDISSLKNASVDWTIFVNKALIKHGNVPFLGEKSVLKMDLPPVKTKVSANLELSVMRDGKKVAGRIFEITLYPPAPTTELKAIFEKVRIGVCDPDGGVKKILDKAGVPYEELNSEIAINSFTGQLLLVGSNAAEAAQLYPLGKLAHANIEKGLKVLMMEQNKLLPDREFKKLDAPENPAKEIELLDHKHGIFGGMTSSDFSEWADDGTVARFPLGDFSAFSWRPLAKMPGQRRAYADPVNLIVELRAKQGQLLYCQLPVAEKFYTEPLAAEFFMNALRYLCHPPTAKAPKKVCAYGTENDLNGLDKQMELSQKNPVDPPADALLVLIPGEDYLGNLAARNPEQLRRIGNRVRSGATLVILPLHEKAGEQLRALLVDDSPAPVVKSGTGTAPVKLVERGDCLTGLCQEDFTEIFRARAADEKKVQNRELRKNELRPIDKAPKDIELLAPGLLIKRQLGHGRVFFCQLPLDSYNSTAGKLVARLFWENLTNPLNL